MALENIDVPAVSAALAEFDALGREAFLEKYGFGRARSYYVLDDGRRYDSKPIVGAAHAHATGERLRPEQFSGGESTVARRLRALGLHRHLPDES